MLGRADAGNNLLIMGKEGGVHSNDRCITRSSTMPTGNIPEAPELGTPHYQGERFWSQWCPL